MSRGRRDGTVVPGTVSRLSREASKAIKDYIAKNPGYKPDGHRVYGAVPGRKSKTHLPTALRLKMTRKGRTATFTYEEDFDDVVVVAYTAKMAEPIMPPGMKVSVRNSGKTIRMAGTTDYSVIAGMISSEFMMWNPAAEMTLGDIMIEALMSKSREAQAKAALDLVSKGLGEIKMPSLSELGTGAMFKSGSEPKVRGRRG